MTDSPIPKLKFCGITRQADADAANGLGADFCGFIFHPRSPRFISPERAARIETGRVARVGVFVEQDAEEILAVMEVARLDFAQLHGRQTPGCARALGGRVIRAIWPARHANMEEIAKEMESYAPWCAWFLLDAGLSGGGHGQALDFGRLAGLHPPRPWFLAGGLNAENIPRALADLRPDGLDINSGVEEAPGVKNRKKMAAAVKAAGRTDI